MRPPALAWVVVLGALACQSGLGGGGSLTVAGVQQRGDYLDARLGDRRRSLRGFAPASSLCRYVLEPGARVAYEARPPGGRFVREDAHCDAVGIGPARIALAAAPGGSPVARRRASYRILHEDAEVVLLRGDFPLATHVGWSDAADVVAVVPNTPVCRTPVERGYGAMDFQPGEAMPLSLVGRNGLCPLVGLARPLG